MEQINKQNIFIKKISNSHNLIISNFKTYEKELKDFLVEDALEKQSFKFCLYL